jgi:hypothetical protein
MKSLPMGIRRYRYKEYNYHDSWAYGYKQSRILSGIEGMVWVWNGLVFGLAVWSIESPYGSCCVVYLLIQLNVGSLAYNFNFRKWVLINYEPCIGAFLLQPYYLIYLVFYPCISFIFCTYLVPTISILNLVISPCCTNLLLQKWRWL